MRTQSGACGALLSALDRFLHDHQQVVLAVPDQEAQRRLRASFLGVFRPHATLSWVIGDSMERPSPVALNRDRVVLEHQPTIYQCRDFQCDLPLVGPAAKTWLGELLAE